MVTSASAAWVIVAVVIASLAAMLALVVSTGLRRRHDSQGEVAPEQQSRHQPALVHDRPLAPSQAAVQRAARAVAATQRAASERPSDYPSPLPGADDNLRLGSVRAPVAGVVVGVCALALALWLVVSAVVLGYQPSDARTDAFLNEAVAAIAIGAAGLGRISSPTQLRRTTVVQLLLSCWLTAAPFAVGYGDDLVVARNNDVTAGIAGVVLATGGLAFAERSPALPRR